MRTKTLFTLGFFATIVPVLWVIISFARESDFSDPVSILCAILGGFLITFAARKTLKNDLNFPKGPGVD